MSTMQIKNDICRIELCIFRSEPPFYAELKNNRRELSDERYCGGYSAVFQS